MFVMDGAFDCCCGSSGFDFVACGVAHENAVRKLCANVRQFGLVGSLHVLHAHAGGILKFADFFTLCPRLTHARSALN